MTTNDSVLVEHARESARRTEDAGEPGWRSDAALLDELADAIERFSAAEETWIMQLAACSTAAIQNTELTRNQRIEPGHPYFSAAYGDICAAVDREMTLRERLSASGAGQTALTRLNELGSLMPHLRNLIDAVAYPPEEKPHSWHPLTECLDAIEALCISPEAVAVKPERRAQVLRWLRAHFDSTPTPGPRFLDDIFALIAELETAGAGQEERERAAFMAGRVAYQRNVSAPWAFPPRDPDRAAVLMDEEAWQAHKAATPKPEASAAADRPVKAGRGQG